MRYYKLQEIRRYTRDVQIACERTGVPARFPSDSWELSKNDVSKISAEFKQAPTKHNLERYAQAVDMAAAWLQAQKPDLRDARLKFFNEHINNIKQSLGTIIPSRKITPPEDYSSDSFFNLRLRTGAKSQLEASEEVKLFLSSPVFLELEKYQENTLKNDQRSHFFGYLKNQEKSVILQELIDVLKMQKTIDGVGQVFKQFYEDYDTRGKVTRYDVVNTGQDILTYILGIFGLKKTTSAELLDNVVQYCSRLPRSGAVTEMGAL